MDQVASTERPADWERARAEAAKVLREFGVGEPPVPVIKIAREHGLTVQFARFPAKRSKVSGFIDTAECKVFVNVAEPPQRQLFTVAHELGHWLLHREEVDDDKMYRVLMREPLSGPKPAMEKEADAFAAALLVPERLLDRYWHAPVRPSRQSLARLFGVSEEMIGYRLREFYGA